MNLKKFDEFNLIQERLQKLPKHWTVKMYPEVYKWVRFTLDLRGVSYEPSRYWWPERNQTWHEKVPYKEYIELSREEFNKFILNKDINDPNFYYDLRNLDREYSTIGPENVSNNEREKPKEQIEYSRDPMGYNFLKSRRP